MGDYYDLLLQKSDSYHEKEWCTLLTLYTSPSCTSCRKARAWLQEHQIPFVERNIFSEPLNSSELKAILQMTEDGTEEIISTRSKVFQKLNMDLDDLPLQELLELVQNNPGLLRRPIMIDDLYKLLSYPNKIFTRQQLMDDIWGLDTNTEERTIDVHIKRLRTRFEKTEDFQIITVRGLGYKAVI